MPEESEFLCGDWLWDPVLREMRHYPGRGKKGHADEPDAVERLEPPVRVRLHRWSQQPMQTSTGHVMPARQARVVVEYSDGRKLDINEPDRECAVRIAATIGESYGVAVEELGAPSGRTGGNLPRRDEMERLVCEQGSLKTVLDEAFGELRVSRRKRLFRDERRAIRTTEIRRLELDYKVAGPNENFAVYAVAGPEEERVPVASYTGLEGWADPEEWRQFTADLARRLGVEARV